MNASGSAPDGSGRSWQTAFTSLHLALNAAESDGCVVWVAKGTYRPETGEYGNATPSDPKALSFIPGPNVALYGGFAGTERHVSERNLSSNESRLSGDIADDDPPDSLFNNDTDNSYHVLVAEDSSERLDGFTITGGRASSADDFNGYGGGILNHASLFIKNCTFESNVANKGGAIFNSAARPKIESCLFTEN